MLYKVGRSILLLPKGRNWEGRYLFSNFLRYNLSYSSSVTLLYMAKNVLYIHFENSIPNFISYYIQSIGMGMGIKLEPNFSFLEWL